MLQLFLSEPTWAECDQNGESHERRRSLLCQLESVVWSLLSSEGRSEARLWLCSAISGIRSISPRRQRDLFVKLLRSKPVKRHLASQLLQLIFEKQPQKLGPVIAKKSHKLENFFKGNPRRIMQWFSNFSDLEHGNGAKALARYAFVNRDLCWEELEWKGKHGQSPAMVATKPHYFLDLDVQRTVENFLEYVPEFWSSNEFSESLIDGSILLVDTKFFVNLFIDIMYKEDLDEIWDVIQEFLVEQSFSFLCHHLLIILEEEDLRVFLDLIPNYLKSKSDKKFDNPSEWLEIILSEYGASSTIDQLVLLNAVTNQGRQLLRLLKEEGSKEEKEKMKNLVFQLCELSSCASDLASLVGGGLEMKPLEFITKLGLQSWAIQFNLSEEFRSRESWESLFISNGIKFRKSDKYVLLLDDDIPENCEPHYDGKPKKQRKHKKRRRKDFDRIEGYEDDLVDFSKSKNGLDLNSEACDWLLSTDGYSATWSSVDLPEYLSKHCFIRWLKWVLPNGG